MRAWPSSPEWVSAIGWALQEGTRLGDLTLLLVGHRLGRAAHLGITALLEMDPRHVGISGVGRPEPVLDHGLACGHRPFLFPRKRHLLDASERPSCDGAGRWGLQICAFGNGQAIKVLADSTTLSQGTSINRRDRFASLLNDALLAGRSAVRLRHHHHIGTDIASMRSLDRRFGRGQPVDGRVARARRQPGEPLRRPCDAPHWAGEVGDVDER